jgi:hypothetical protein
MSYSKTHRYEVRETFATGAKILAFTDSLDDSISLVILNPDGEELSIAPNFVRMVSGIAVNTVVDELSKKIDKEKEDRLGGLIKDKCRPFNNEAGKFLPKDKGWFAGMLPDTPVMFWQGWERNKNLREVYDYKAVKPKSNWRLYLTVAPENLLLSADWDDEAGVLDLLEAIENPKRLHTLLALMNPEKATELAQYLGRKSAQQSLGS